MYASLNALKLNGAIDNRPDNPPKMDHEPWILWLTKTLTVLETQLADEGCFSTREGWKRTLQGTGRRKMATEKRTFQQRSKTRRAQAEP